MPAGLGEPVFDRLDADIAKALMCIPAVKGVEIGAGFAVVARRGSENNDAFETRDGRIRTRTNNAGGILGGISTGEPIVVRMAVKPTSSIVLEQETVTQAGEPTTVKVLGRHDPCVCPAPSRSPRRWWRWCWPTTCCANAPPASKQFAVGSSQFAVSELLSNSPARRAIRQADRTYAGNCLLRTAGALPFLRRR